ncbi:MAG: isochorismatase family protein [Patescibacteria group bacterium]
MAKRILVVIDMQKGAAQGGYHGRYLNKKWWKQHEAVVARIRVLSKKMETIFQIHTDFRKKKFLEVVTGLASIAQNSRVIFKGEDDGSAGLAEIISKDTHIYVCGMNTDACIQQTVRGLKARGYYTVTVVGDACWTVYASDSPESHVRALRMLQRNGVRILETKAVR